MKKVKSPSGKNVPAFINDIKEDGYHVFSLKNANIPNYYPAESPKYPGVCIRDLKIDDVISIRVFFGIGTGKNMRIDGGMIDLRIEHINENSVMAEVLTILPESFPLGSGHSIEVYEEEILYRASSTEH